MRPVAPVDLDQADGIDEFIPLTEAFWRLPNPVICVRADDRVLFVNECWRRLIGYGMDELRSVEDWWQLAYPDHAYRAEVRTRWLQALRAAARPAESDRKPDPVTGRIRCKDGKTRIVEAHFSVIDGIAANMSQAHPIYVVCLNDVTQARLAMEELAAAREAAESSDKAKSFFLATMSHELRTPLNAIIGFSEIIRREIFGPVAPERYGTYIKDIHSSALHLLNVVGDILDLTKIASGGIELAPIDCQVLDFVRECSQAISPQAAETGIAICLDMPDDLRISADPILFRRVALNLLSNAVKFTGAQGRITVAAQHGPPGWAEIAVTDTGIGMSEPQIALALKPFSQVDNSLTRRRQGSGLGLTIAKQLTELHGGTLDIHSRPDEGTTVRLRWPAAR